MYGSTESRVIDEKKMKYGAISTAGPLQRASSMNIAATVSLLLASCGLALLVLSGLGREAHSQQALLMQAQQMNMVPLSQTQMLCEGHFIDTATGVPDTPFTTLHHPGELPGYVEPLPPDIRAAIDAKVYSDLVSASAESSPLRVLCCPPSCVCAILMAVSR
jgi:hypothetical protein